MTPLYPESHSVIFPQPLRTQLVMAGHDCIRVRYHPSAHAEAFLQLEVIIARIRRACPEMFVAEPAMTEVRTDADG